MVKIKCTPYRKEMMLIGTPVEGWIKMNMRDYLTLHLDTNKSKGMVYSKKWYGSKWTWETI